MNRLRNKNARFYLLLYITHFSEKKIYIFNSLINKTLIISILKNKIPVINLLKYFSCSCLWSFCRILGNFFRWKERTAQIELEKFEVDPFFTGARSLFGAIIRLGKRNTIRRSKRTKEGFDWEWLTLMKSLSSKLLYTTQMGIASQH